ncbi:MAG: hypothetical protein ACJ76H_11670 [Bacteriovoracaceae bacterium]
MMKTILTMLFLFMSLSSFAGEAEIKSLLPKRVQELTIGKTTSTAAVEILGMPDLVKGPKQYWAEDGFKYAIELTFAKGRLASLHYSFPKRPDSSVLKDEFKEEDFKPVAGKQDLRMATRDHAEVVVNVAQKKIESVRIK